MLASLPVRSLTLRMSLKCAEQAERMSRCALNRWPEQESVTSVKDSSPRSASNETWKLLWKSFQRRQNSWPSDILQQRTWVRSDRENSGRHTSCHRGHGSDQTDRTLAVRQILPQRTWVRSDRQNSGRQTSCHRGHGSDQTDRTLTVRHPVTEVMGQIRQTEL